VIIAHAPDRTLLVAQPAHAALSGQFARAWDFAALPALAEDAREAVCLGIALHDLSWIDFEAAPSFNPATGLPHGFREVPARRHAPRWAASVDQAAGFGPWPALLASRHGIRIYEKFFRRDRAEPADVAAADAFLAAQHARFGALCAAAGANEAAAHQADLLTGACDWLSLLFCGDPMRTARVPEVPMVSGVSEVEVRLLDKVGTIAPWPFAAPRVAFTCAARALPAGARFGDEATMRAGLAAAVPVTLRWALEQG
jgi:hypothetical protein